MPGRTFPLLGAPQSMAVWSLPVEISVWIRARVNWRSDSERSFLAGPKRNLATRGVLLSVVEYYKTILPTFPTFYICNFLKFAFVADFTVVCHFCKPF